MNLNSGDHHIKSFMPQGMLGTIIDDTKQMYYSQHALRIE